MKKTKIYNILILFAFVALFSSCEKYFEDINIDPDNPAEVTPDVILPNAIVTLGYGIHGDMSRYTAMLVQQAEGRSRQWATYQTYQITETETDNWWRFNMYAGALNDLYLLNKLAEENNYTLYAASAKTLLAYGLLVTSQLIGDIPYTEAFQGADNLTPVFDSQQSIYAAIQQLITDAKAGFDAGAAPITPGDDDLLYKGDAAKWRKFANAISARAYVHLGKKDVANYSSALAAIDDGTFADASEDATFSFGVGATEAGPWFQFNQQRGDIGYLGTNLHTMMTANGDPRTSVYVDTSAATEEALGAWFNRPDAAFFFHSYVEVKFIEAEAAFQTGAKIRAAAAHNAGVLASLARYGVSDAAWETANANEDMASITLEKIMTQKHIAMFLDVEAFADWRRTGFPTLVAVPGNVTGGVIPRRLPYPQSERLFNSGNVPSAGITTSVWWDN